MVCEFRTKKLLGQIPVSSELSLYYENLIQIIVNDFTSAIDASKLNTLIVPDDFMNEIIEFQKQIGIKNPSVTNNEFGRAFGKMIHDEKNDTYFIFIDPDIATFVMDDNMFNRCFSSFDEENKTLVVQQRKQALNLIAHEMAHIEFDTKVKRPYFNRCYSDGLLSQAYVLFDEYYACRKASIVAPGSLIEDNGDYIIKIEQFIDEERWKYKTREKSLDEFVALFHKYAELVLIRTVSIAGENIGRELPIKITDLLENTEVQQYADSLAQVCDEIYGRLETQNEITIDNRITDIIDQYFISLGVQISDSPQGVYYAIPD